MSSCDRHEMKITFCFMAVCSTLDSRQQSDNRGLLWQGCVSYGHDDLCSLKYVYADLDEFGNNEFGAKVAGLSYICMDTLIRHITHFTVK